MGTAPNTALDFYLNQALKMKTKWKKLHRSREAGESAGRHVGEHNPTMLRDESNLPVHGI